MSRIQLAMTALCALVVGTAVSYAVLSGSRAAGSESTPSSSEVAEVSRACSPDPVQRGAIRRPETYRSFVHVTPANSALETAINQADHVWLAPGRYPVDNPLVIDRETPLYLHGGNRLRTKLFPRNPDEPLFVVKRASLINLQNIRLESAKLESGEAVLGSTAFQFQNTAPLRFEMLDGSTFETTLRIGGPGTFLIAGSSLVGHGYVQTPLLVDHRCARTYVVGGAIRNGSARSKLRFETRDFYHAWQRQGLLRVVGVGLSGGLGRADFRIDSPAPSELGPHMIAGIRSEGANNADAVRAGSVSSFVYVPPSDEAVDVMVKANSGAWHGGKGAGYGKAHFAEYHAAGTLWLLGNQSLGGAGQLAIGKAPKATVVALGNLLYGKSDVGSIAAKRKIAAGNLYSHKLLTRETDPPYSRFREPATALSGSNSIPTVPRVEIDAVLDFPPRPRVTAPLPGMISIKSEPFNAKGDGVVDDTAAIQAALDASGPGQMIFFPAGTYRVTAPLLYNWRTGSEGESKDPPAAKHADDPRHPIYPPHPEHRNGGWLVGEGSDRVLIRRDHADKGSVLLAGFAYMTVQGLSFETAPYDPSQEDPIDKPGVEIAFGPTAPQKSTFYDVSFSGGTYGIGFAATAGPQCSEFMLVYCAFSNAKYGYGSWDANALSNIVVNGKFRNNAHVGQLRDGHTLLGVSVRGTRESDIVVVGHGARYFHRYDSDSSRLFGHTSTSVPFGAFFDQALLHPNGTAEPVWDHGHGQGVFFLNSELSRGFVRLEGRSANKFVFSVQSELADWSHTKVGATGRKYRLP